MIVVSQAPTPLPDDGDDIIASTRHALANGFTVFHLPPSLLRLDDLTEPLAAIPPQSTPQPAIWIGTIPDESIYRAVYTELLARNIQLLNSPDEHLDVFEFDRAYPKISDLTAPSVVIDDPDQLTAAVQQVGLPAFLKGALLSRKHSGWRACVADTLDDARLITQKLLRQRYLSRGRVIVRALLPLRRFSVPASEFPVGREYRVFLLHGEPLAHGYYWPYTGEWSHLTPGEQQGLLTLARTAAARFTTPLVALDIGQLEDLTWKIIETGDPQFSGLSFIDPRTLWQNLAARLARST